MTTIKDRNDKDLTEAEEMKWQEYTEPYKKVLITQVNVVTHLDLDTLECEVKWALGSITANKASEGDGIPAKLFQILKDAAAKVLHSICQQIWKTQQWLKKPDPLQEKSCIFYSPIYMTFKKTENSAMRIKCC